MQALQRLHATLIKHHLFKQIRNGHHCEQAVHSHDIMHAVTIKMDTLSFTEAEKCDQGFAMLLLMLLCSCV